MKIKFNVYVTLLILTIILFIASVTYNNYTYTMILFLVIITLLKQALIKRSITEIQVNKKSIYYLLFLILIFLQLLFLQSFETTKDYFIMIVFGLLMICLILNNINNFKTLSHFYIIWAYIVLFTIVVGYWEINTGISIRSNVAYPGMKVATVGFFNQNNYSFFLAVSLPIIFYLFQLNFYYKMLAIIITINIVNIIYINDTRSILLLSWAAIIIFLFKLLIGKRKSVTILFAILSL